MSKDRRLNQPFYREDQSETKRCCRGKRDGGLFKSQSSVASVLVSALIILNHFLFIKGQFLPLYQFSLDAKIENVYVELDLPKKGKSLNFSVPDVAISFPVANFTYNSTLTGLWTFNQVTQKYIDLYHIKDPEAEGFTFSPVSPYLLYFFLLIFSGIWPHVKLAAVHLLWYVPAPAKKRSTWLWWIEYFGKFSMADVFVVMVTISCLRIDFPTSSTKDITDNLLNHLPDFIENSTDHEHFAHAICGPVMNSSFFQKKNWTNVTKCEGYAVTALETDWVYTALETFSHKLEQGLIETGSIGANLNVQTLEGIYYFSSAVWLTLLVSAFVGHVSEKVAKNRIADPDEWRQPKRSLLALRFPDRSAVWRMMVGLAAFAVPIALVLGGVLLPLMTKTVPGIFSEILALLLDDDSSSDFTETMSLERTIARLTKANPNGDSNGVGNSFLQKDLWIFTFICPILTLVLGTVVLNAPLSSKLRSQLVVAMNLAFSFSGWEVMVIATILMTLEAGNSTLTLALENFYPLCYLTQQVVIDNPSGNLCFEEDITIEWQGFLCLCLATVCLFLMKSCVARWHSISLDSSSKWPTALLGSASGLHLLDNEA